MQAKTAGLGATPSPDIWTLPGSVHQMRLHNERSAQPRQPGRPHLARSTWSKRICLPGSPVLWGEGFHFFRWSPPFPPSPPEKLHLGSAWLWRCLWTLCLGFPVFITRKNSWFPVRDYRQQTTNPCFKSRLKLQFIGFSLNLQNLPAARQPWFYLDTNGAITAFIAEGIRGLLLLILRRVS